MAEQLDVAVGRVWPVGQALALALAQRGHRVVVVERNPALHTLPRAVGFDHEDVSAKVQPAQTAPVRGAI